MPIYEYACTACDHRADILHGINDPGPNFCPSCGAEGTMKKVFAAPAVHFKGSGWAKKDRNTGAKSRKSDATADGDGGDKGAADKGATDKGGTDKPGSEKTGTEKAAKGESTKAETAAKADKPASSSSSSAD